MWLLSQVGKATDCNSVTIGPNPLGASKPSKKLKKTFLKKFRKLLDFLFNIKYII